MAQARKDWLEWFRVDRDIMDNPKIVALAAEGGWTRDKAVGRLIRLWAWVARHAPSGHLTEFGRSQLDNYLIDSEMLVNHGMGDECACCGKGPDEEDCKQYGRRLAPFFLAGLLEETESGGCTVHDWDAMNGYGLRERERKREGGQLDARRAETSRKKRGKRAELPGFIRPTRARRNGDGNGDGTESPSALPQVLPSGSEKIAAAAAEPSPIAETPTGNPATLDPLIGSLASKLSMHPTGARAPLMAQVKSQVEALPPDEKARWYKFAGWLAKDIRDDECVLRVVADALERNGTVGNLFSYYAVNGAARVTIEGHYRADQQDHESKRWKAEEWNWVRAFKARQEANA